MNILLIYQKDLFESDLESETGRRTKCLTIPSPVLAKAGNKRNFVNLVKRMVPGSFIVF